MNIKTTADPYGQLIATFIKQELPVAPLPHTDATLLDLLTEAIVASGQVRYGPRPSPESLVAIREVISHWTAQAAPIPFLVAWGSEKPDGSGIDIAELFGLKTLACLNKRISQYYTPGAVFNVRVEDASAPYLFFDNMEKARKDAELYTSGLVSVTSILELKQIIRLIPESYIVTEAQFNEAADKILPHMIRHIANPFNEQVQAELKELGMQTPVSAETRRFYLDRYVKLYPDKSEEQRELTLARYMASAVVRKGLGLTGEAKHWGGKFLELSFHAPAPGFSKQRALRRIYYRTMPSSITSNHLPPWRAKGFLKINGEVTAGLTSFNNQEYQFNPNTIELTREQESQTVQADYIIL